MDVTSTARASQDVVSTVKGGTRVTMIDLHRLLDPQLTRTHPSYRRPRRHREDVIPGDCRDTMSLRTSHRRRWQFVLPKVPENNMMSRVLLHRLCPPPPRPSEKKSNLQRRPTTYAPNDKSTSSGSLSAGRSVLFQSLFIKYMLFGRYRIIFTFI